RAFLEAAGEGPPAQDLHAEERPAVMLVQIEDADDGGMIERPRHRHLPPEARRERGVLREVIVQRLERDLLAADAVARLKHFGDAAGAEAADDFEAVGEQHARPEGAHALQSSATTRAAR